MRKIVAVTLFLLLASLEASGAVHAIALPAGSGLFGIERAPVTAEVAHYRFDLRVGAGEHDVIRLHRVVRETAPWVPARGQRGAFLVHGDGWGFEPSFLAGGPGSDRGLALHLAEGGVDAWGIDFRWTLVPGDVTDLSFMDDWGIATALADLDRALTVARASRVLTGSGPGRLHLVGFSRGGQLGWAQAAAETSRPPAFRHVRGLVSIENAFRYDDESLRQADCASYQAIADSLAAGVYATDYRFVADVGDLALSAPEDPSPFFPALSNADLAEWLGADPGGGAIPHFHSVGGIVDPMTLETELLYTASEDWFTFLSDVTPFQPLRVSLDGAAIGCGAPDTPFDDGLESIDVPILYVGVAGAYGDLGVHTTTLVASGDVEARIVTGAADPREDWGHNDPLLAEDADAEVWDPVLDWILAR